MKKGLIVIVVMLFITGCSQVKEQAETQSSNDQMTADRLNDESYPILKLATNPARNQYYAELSSTRDFKTVGKQLMALSIPHFSPDSYSMAEGQVLKKEDFDELLKRTNLEVSPKEYPNSLQPDRGTEIEGVLNPVMVGSIYEQDFYDVGGGKNTLVGASFAIIVNPLSENGDKLTKSMSDSALENYGREIIPKLYQYLRTKKEFEKIPLNICVYQSANKIDSTINGHYILQSLCKDGVGEITKTNYKTILFTSTESETQDSTTHDEFSILKSQLKELSTDAVGVTGFGEYFEDSLQILKIEVSINIRTYGELEFFISKASERLDDAFSQGIKVEMVIKSMDQIEAILIKDQGQAVQTIVVQ